MSTIKKNTFIMLNTIFFLLFLISFQNCANPFSLNIAKDKLENQSDLSSTETTQNNEADNEGEDTEADNSSESNIPVHDWVPESITPSKSFDDALSDLNNAGDWASIEYEMSEPYFTTRVTGGHDFTWADSAKWDSKTQCIYHYGGGHLVVPALVIYCPEEGTWRFGKLPPWLNYDGTVWEYAGHGYDKNAMLRGSGELFIQRKKSIFKYNTVTEEWSSTANYYDQEQELWLEKDPNDIPKLPGNNVLSQYEGSAYFPGLGVILAGHFGGLYAYNPSANQYTAMEAEYYDNAQLHTFYEYSYKHNIMIMGGGDSSTRVFTLRSDGSGTETTSSPYPIRPISSGTLGGWVQEDPISGNFIVLYHNKEMYEFNPVTETWKFIGNAPMPETKLWKMMGASMEEHGIISYMRVVDSKKAIVYFYKHSD